MTILSPPRQRRSQATLDAISSAAKELLRTRSFGELTIQEIVKEANSSAGSFYARFKGKRALLHYLHEEFARSSLSELRDFVAASEIGRVTPVELAELLIPELVRSHIENRGILRATLIESLEDPLFVQRAARLLHELAITIAERTTRTAKRKDHHVSNVGRSLASIIAILDQGLFLEKADPARISTTEIARLRRMFVASLRPEDAR